MNPRPYVRRIRWIRPDLQAKILIRFLVLALAVLVAHAELQLLGIWSMMQEATPVEMRVLDSVMSLALKEFMIAAVIALALAIFVAVSFSFRFCGPLFSMKRFLCSVAGGRWNRRLSFRQGDELHDMADAVNAAVGGLTEVVREQDDLLRRAREALGENADAGALIEEIDAARALVAGRLQEGDAGSPAPGAEAAAVETTAATSAAS